MPLLFRAGYSSASEPRKQRVGMRLLLPSVGGLMTHIPRWDAHRYNAAVSGAKPSYLPRHSK